MSAISDMVSSTATGVRLPLLVQPRASRDRVVGAHADAIKVQIASPPVDGAANEAIVRFFSKLFGVSKGAVRIVHGEKGRRKTVEVDGTSVAEVGRILEAAVG